jgi:hypothetical protein
MHLVFFSLELYTNFGHAQAYQNIDRRSELVIPLLIAPNKHVPITVIDLRRTPPENRILWPSSRLTYANLLHHILRQFVRAPPLH